MITGSRYILFFATLQTKHSTALHFVSYLAEKRAALLIQINHEYFGFN
jgi:hypothetical protein